MRADDLSDNDDDKKSRQKSSPQVPLDQTQSALGSIQDNGNMSNSMISYTTDFKVKRRKINSSAGKNQPVGIQQQQQQRRPSQKSIQQSTRQSGGAIQKSTRQSGAGVLKSIRGSGYHQSIRGSGYQNSIRQSGHQNVPPKAQKAAEKPPPPQAQVQQQKNKTRASYLSGSSSVFLTNTQQVQKNKKPHQRQSILSANQSKQPALNTTLSDLRNTMYLKQQREKAEEAKRQADLNRQNQSEVRSVRQQQINAPLETGVISRRRKQSSSTSEIALSKNRKNSLRGSNYQNNLVAGSRKHKNQTSMIMNSKRKNSRSYAEIDKKGGHGSKTQRDRLDNSFNRSIYNPKSSYVQRKVANLNETMSVTGGELQPKKGRSQQNLVDLRNQNQTLNSNNTDDSIAIPNRFMDAAAPNHRSRGSLDVDLDDTRMLEERRQRLEQIEQTQRRDRERELEREREREREIRERQREREMERERERERELERERERERQEQEQRNNSDNFHLNPNDLSYLENTDASPIKGDQQRQGQDLNTTAFSYGGIVGGDLEEENPGMDGDPTTKQLYHNLSIISQALVMEENKPDDPRNRNLDQSGVCQNLMGMSKHQLLLQQKQILETQIRLQRILQSRQNQPQGQSMALLNSPDDQLKGMLNMGENDLNKTMMSTNTQATLGGTNLNNLSVLGPGPGLGTLSNLNQSILNTGPSLNTSVLSSVQNQSNLALGQNIVVGFFQNLSDTVRRLLLSVGQNLDFQRELVILENMLKAGRFENDQERMKVKARLLEVKGKIRGNDAWNLLIGAIMVAAVLYLFKMLIS